MISPRIAGSTPFFGKAGDRQRGERRAGHRPDVVDRVERGDATVIKRVVNDRREKIDRLDDRQIVAQSIHSGVVGFVKTNHDVLVKRLFR